MKLLVVLASMVLLVGCASSNSVGDAKGSGKIAFYNYTYDKVWASALAAVQESQLTLVAKDKEGGKIIARGNSAVNIGDNVAVFITAVDKSSTMVEVAIQRENKNSKKPIDWSEIVLTKIRELVK